VAAVAAVQASVQIALALEKGTTMNSGRHIHSAAALLLVSLTSLAPAFAQEPPRAALPSTIRVVAESIVSVKPTKAEIEIGVISRAKTAQAAAEDNARKIDRIVDGLQKSLGKAAEIKTVSYLVNPHYVDNPRGGPPIPEGYLANNLVRVRLTDLQLVPRTIDQSLKLGANEVQQLSFGLLDEGPVQIQALQAAASKARARATAVAASLGLRVVRILQVDEGEPTTRPVLYAEANMRAKLQDAPATRIEPGDVDVRATVTLTVEVTTK
jgi:uncharacterized protein